MVREPFRALHSLYSRRGIQIDVRYRISSLSGFFLYPSLFHSSRMPLYTMIMFSLV